MTLLPDANLGKKMESEEKAKIEQFRKSLTTQQVKQGGGYCVEPGFEPRLWMALLM